MPGAMHRMGVYLGLVEDDEYAEADGYGQPAERPPSRREEYAERESRPPRESRGELASYSREYPANGRGDHGYGEAAYSGGSQATYVDDLPPQPTYQITALHPRTYNEARTIGEQFRKNTPVIMNLSDMDDADAKRLVDFAAGLTFGLHGRIERVTAKVFLLSPHNVSVTAQDKARIENGFFNQS
ncbi:cell division protein SepF [uncultured Jatrophihabitans sp.]|uniref:cell division protein SepF n=1 Tax=uncultured Jatrophihabitans sp. TaxID=1610747 RepID=UPI0035CC27DC